MNLTASTSYTFAIYITGTSTLMNTVSFTTPARPANPSSQTQIASSTPTPYGNNMFICNYNASIVSYVYPNVNNNTIYVSTNKGVTNTYSTTTSVGLYPGCFGGTINWTGNFIYWCIGSKCYYSTNGGQSFSNATVSGLTLNNVSFSPQILTCNYLGDKIYACSNPTNATMNLYYSSDYGLTYSIIASVSSGSSVGEIYALPDFSKAICILNNTTTYGILQSGSYTNFTTYNVTNIDTTSSNLVNMSLSIDPSTNYYYVGGTKYIYQSTNGSSWTRLCNYPTYTGTVTTTIPSALMLSTLNMDYIYASDNNTAYHSLNKGGSWSLDISYVSNPGMYVANLSPDGSTLFYTWVNWGVWSNYKVYVVK